MLNVNGISKAYSSNEVIKRLSLDVERQMTLVVLGPSGCGKTTLLRLIAGFEMPDEGTIKIDGQLVSGGNRPVPPHRRRLGFVFQDLALWPHMTVEKNVAYCLRSRQIPGSLARDLVSQVLRQVCLNGQRSRFPGQLSGGERQRVALARALVAQPDLILFDEPLSHMEPSLRRELCDLVISIKKEKEFASIWVTHNRSEALQMADNLAVMRNGRILQVGTPGEVVSNPVDTFVDGFLND